MINHSAKAEWRNYGLMVLRVGFEKGGPVTFTLKHSLGIADFLECSNMDFCEGPPFYGFQSFSYGYRIRFGKEYKNYFFVDMQKGNYLGGA